MPITIKVALHGAAECSFPTPPVTCPEKLLQESCPKQFSDCKKLLQSSFEFDVDFSLQSSPNGFVLGAIQAYGSHHHLRLRPDDVWFAILSQLSCYVNKYTKGLRDELSLRDRMEFLELETAQNRYTLDTGPRARKMSWLLKRDAGDLQMRDWVTPNFTTTRITDRAIASILMVGVLKKGFVYANHSECGIPSVTLLGEKMDWVKILRRLEALKMLGGEPRQWYHLIQPVLNRFIKTFDRPDSDEVVDFWERMIHRDSRSGTETISGWINAFCLWNEDGDLLYPPQYLQSGHDTHEDLPPLADYDATDSEFETWEYLRRPVLRLDGATYGQLDMAKIPSGYTSVMVRVEDTERTFNATVVAGSVGIICTSSGDAMANGQLGLDTIQAESGWWMFE